MERKGKKRGGKRGLLGEEVNGREVDQNSVVKMAI